MSFDICGNNLRAGHCEAHPGVHEEYPCSLCMAESQQREQQQAIDQQRAQDYYREQEMDALRSLLREARDWIARELQATEVELPDAEGLCKRIGQVLPTEGR